MTNPTNKEELVARLEAKRQDAEARRLKFNPGALERLFWAGSVDAYDTALSLTRATPESPHNPGQGDGG